MNEYRRRCDRAERNERANMSGARHHTRRRDAPTNEARIIGGHQQADQLDRKPFNIAAYRDQRALQPAASQEDPGRQEQSRKGKHGRAHRQIDTLILLSPPITTRPRGPRLGQPATETAPSALRR